MRALLLAALALAGCERASFQDCAITCTPSVGCPDGFACGPEGLCRISGAGGTCADVLSDSTLPSSCEAGHETKLTGKVFAPNGSLPLPGTPVAVTTSDTDGSFVLDNVPTGNLRVVIQTGKWRRQVMVPSVAECEQRALDAEQTRLPKNHSEGDMPSVAISTGLDAVECIVLSLGVDSAEVTADTGTGKFQLYAGTAGSTKIGSTTLAFTDTLAASATKLKRYDMVVMGCDGQVVTRATASAKNLLDYATAGGRLYLTHFDFNWLTSAPTPWPTVGTFADTTVTATSVVDTVNTTSATGMSMAKWLTEVDASTTSGRVVVDVPRAECSAVNTSIAQPLLTLDPALNAGSPKDIQAFEFATPVGGQSCGRVMFSDIHFIDATNGMAFPLECTSDPLSPQQLAIAYLLFELRSCSR